MKLDYDRDEWRMAVFNESEKSTSVRYINPCDNRGAGSSIGNIMSDLFEGTKIEIKVY
ncbi:NucA/NucB deoxyribonuclease domain-containing protein [Snodgrassella alvi]|uniref:NucA/NucB deoxyribonuclease domain-containing protein n=1 Tax=Snodgrassella alvi TaxID=1196083 RepID=UPI00117A88F6|nr:NucA/NucB deoxyribonuclease domain-containing protein [Snodgrassella alvi]